MLAQAAEEGRQYARLFRSGMENELRSTVRPGGYIQASTQQRATAPVRILVPVSLSIDGKQMAVAVSPHIAEEIVGGMYVSAQVTDASRTPALQQGAFRTLS
jgi:hypothetical protein